MFYEQGLPCCCPCMTYNRWIPGRSTMWKHRWSTRRNKMHTLSAVLFLKLQETVKAQLQAAWTTCNSNWNPSGDQIRIMCPKLVTWFGNEQTTIYQRKAAQTYAHTHAHTPQQTFLSIGGHTWVIMWCSWLTPSKTLHQPFHKIQCPKSTLQDLN